MHDATLETAGRVFELAGSVLGLMGVVVTGIGLFIAWRRVSQRRLDELRAVFRDLGGRIGERLTSEREREVHSVSARLSSEGTLSATVVNGSLTVPEQVISVLRQLADQARTEVPESPPLLTLADIDAALARFQTGQDVVAARDLSTALIGLGITAIGVMASGFGIILGM